jgi:hypothetical protein
MARRIGVELVLDDAAYLRGLKRSAAGTTKFTKEVERAGRGAAAGSGLFRNMGRSIAFASGSFLGFATATEFLRSSIDAARDAAVSQRALAAQMKASGQSFTANQARIEEVTRSYSKFGFQNDEVVKSLTVLERGTGSINKAISLQGLTADLARAKNIQLADAANTVAKVFGGQETALRRAVPGLEKNAHGMDLIREAQQRLAGQAAANTTASERFAATLHDTQEIIGTALLPSLNKILNQLSRWMADSQNQAKIQKGANAAASAGAIAFSNLATGVGLAADAYEKLNGAFKGLSGKSLLGFAQAHSPLGVAIEAAREVGNLVGGGGGGAAGQQGLLPFPIPFRPGQKPAAAPTPPPRKPLSLVGQFNLAELRLAKAQLTATQADDRRILVTEAAILEKQIAGAKTLKDKIALTNQLASINDQILATDQASSKVLKEQNKTLKDRADAIKSAVLDRLQQRQTGIENQRALKDAQAALRTARLLGGPGGIRLAQRGVSDARFAILQARLEAAPATLRAGTFALGNVITVNVHGSESPEKVAAQVVAIIQRKSRHTSTQSRGPTAGR